MVSAAVTTNRPIPLRTVYEASRTWSALHTGGQAALAADNDQLCTTLGDQVVITSASSGNRVSVLVGDSSQVIALACTPDIAYSALLIAYRSLFLRLYLLSPEGPQLVKSTPQAHDSPIATISADYTSSLFATGDTAGVVKVWDARQGHCTHVFRGHGGIISALAFDVDVAADRGKGRARLVVGSGDCRARMWDLVSRKLVAVLEGHMSAVRGAAVSKDGQTVVTGGRDSLVNVWDFSATGMGRLRRAIAVHEPLEAVGLCEVPSSSSVAPLLIYTGGEQGRVKIWSALDGQPVALEGGTDIQGLPMASIQDIRALPRSRSLLVIRMDHNISILAMLSLETQQQFIGFNDEIVDLALVAGKEAQSIAIATNSPLIRVYNTVGNQISLLPGHSDTVLALAQSTVIPLLASGSKDNTARLWSPHDKAGANAWSCVAICEGHVGSVGAVALGRRHAHLLVSASQDRTMKIWYCEIPEGNPPSGQPAKGRSLATLKIHDKDINAVDVAPNDRLVASASQDRLGKIFALDYTPQTKSGPARAQFRHVGTLRGHARGLWTIRFSTHDQCIATGAGDRTIKLWSLSDYSCLKTFEGHTNSVLRIDFLGAGTQLASASSDGLVKVWSIKNEQCTTTLDGHDDKVWALAVGTDGEHIFTAGGDSQIIMWKDATLQRWQAREEASEKAMTRAQNYDNYVATSDYRNAILLALAMRNQARLLKLFQEVSRLRPRFDESTAGEEHVSANADSATGLATVDRVIAEMEPQETLCLLVCARDWNSVAKTADVAQGVLHAIFRSHHVRSLLQSGASPMVDPASKGDPPIPISKVNFSTLFNSLLPYTERQYSRVSRLVQESAIISFLLGELGD